MSNVQGENVEGKNNRKCPMSSAECPMSKGRMSKERTTMTRDK
jgi:hypothetical protein